jgi:hypothetical protein
MMGRLHLSPGELVLAFLLAVYVVNQFSVLAHELGHAIVALRSTSGKVTVVVGRQSAALGIVFERLTIWWSPIPARGVPFAGICLCDVRQATPRAQLIMMLAGPAVTALLIPAYVYAAILTARSSPGLIPATFACAAFACFVSCLWNLDPRQTEAEKGARLFRRDGPQALAAYRRMRRN